MASRFRSVGRGVGLDMLLFSFWEIERKNWIRGHVDLAKIPKISKSIIFSHKIIT